MTMAVEVNALNFAYQSGPVVLDKTTFQIAPGERVGLAGANGAGKSTLLLCLAGVLPVLRGAIRINGLDPAEPVDHRQLPRHLGFLFQDPDDQLIHATVADDVAFGPLNLGVSPKEIPTRIEEALMLTGLTGQGGRSPHRLSGGEKRRAALAGVLAMRTNIILLDEPTSDLDPRGRSELAELLKGLDATLLIATHDLEFLRMVCQRSIMLENGRLVADGKTAELLSDDLLLRRHGLQ